MCHAFLMILPHVLSVLFHSWHPLTSVTLFPSLTSPLPSDHCFTSVNFRHVCSTLLITKISSVFYYLCLPPLEFGKRHNWCLLLFKENWIGSWPAGYLSLISSDLWAGPCRCWNDQRGAAGKWKNNIKGTTKDICNAMQMETGSLSSCWPLFQCSK